MIDRLELIAFVEKNGILPSGKCSNDDADASPGRSAEGDEDIWNQPALTGEEAMQRVKQLRKEGRMPDLQTLREQSRKVYQRLADSTSARAT